MNGLRRGTLDDVKRLGSLDRERFDYDRITELEFIGYIMDPYADVLVYQGDHRITGYGIMLYKRQAKSNRAYLYSLCSQDHKGGLILTALEVLAKKRNKGNVKLEVKLDNSAAIRFYTRMGYKPYGVVENFYEDGSTALQFSKGI